MLNYIVFYFIPFWIIYLNYLHLAGKILMIYIWLITHKGINSKQTKRVSKKMFNESTPCGSRTSKKEKNVRPWNSWLKQKIKGNHRDNLVWIPTQIESIKSFHQTWFIPFRLSSKRKIRENVGFWASVSVTLGLDRAYLMVRKIFFDVCQ